MSGILLSNLGVSMDMARFCALNLFSCLRENFDIKIEYWLIYIIMKTHIRDSLVDSAGLRVLLDFFFVEKLSSSTCSCIEISINESSFDLSGFLALVCCFLVNKMAFLKGDKFII